MNQFNVTSTKVVANLLQHDVQHYEQESSSEAESEYSLRQAFKGENFRV